MGDPLPILPTHTGRADGHAHTLYVEPDGCGETSYAWSARGARHMHVVHFWSVESAAGHVHTVRNGEGEEDPCA